VSAVPVLVMLIYVFLWCRVSQSIQLFIADSWQCIPIICLLVHCCRLWWISASESF
jgi:hypothetical protein